MLRFLKDIHEALDRNTDDYIVAFYADFSKAFDRVPHKHLLNKLCSIEVGGCLLDLLYDYLDNRKQYVRIGNHCSNLLDVTSGVPQGSLLGPLLYCIFNNDLPDALRFSQPYIFADDLKLLYTGQNQLDAQSDLSSIEKWVELNQMKLAIEKCGMLTLKGSDGNLSLYKQKLEKVNVIKDLGVFIKNDLSWTCHMTHKRETEKIQQSSLLAQEKHSILSQHLRETWSLQVYCSTNFAVRFSLRQSISDWPTHSRTVPKKSCQMDLRRLNQKLRWKTASTKSLTTSDFRAIKRSSLPLENLPRRRQRIEINTTAQS